MVFLQKITESKSMKTLVFNEAEEIPNNSQEAVSQETVIPSVHLETGISSSSQDILIQNAQMSRLLTPLKTTSADDGDQFTPAAAAEPRRRASLSVNTGTSSITPSRPPLVITPRR